METGKFGISVVIPAYNAENRIGRVLQSVLEQTRKIDEIIVVDDGSSDRTSVIAAQYSSLVNCIRQINKGPAKARNTGIQLAKNEWIAFLDDDDQWLPNHVANACKVIGEHPEIQWFCDVFERRSEEGEVLYRSRVDRSLLEAGIIKNYFLAEAKWSFSRTSSMVVRKSVFDVAGSFNGEIIPPWGEDLDMWFRIALFYPQIGFSSDPGCIYLFRKGSITGRKSTDLLAFLRRIEITRQSGLKSHLGLTRESEVLICRWVIDAFKHALKQKDKQSLAVILGRFKNLLPMRWKVASWVFQKKGPFEAANAVLKLRSRIKYKGQG